jgi:uncharacterized protein YifE (UPF0438 family)
MLRHNRLGRPIADALEQALGNVPPEGTGSGGGGHPKLDIPTDHRSFLQRRPFVFRCSTAIFPADELQALSDYGNWLEALAQGVIQPVTAEQEQFLRVDREEAEPISVCERAWVRLKGRREYEHDRYPDTPATGREDYGIVEWDADRCWW